MADLPSILGGMAQGFLDFGKSAVDLFGTGGASIADLIESARTGKVTTKNSDDFRKWLYDTDDVKDAAAKGLGTALNGVQTVSDYIPGIGAVTRNPLFNAGQGALGGLADEFKMYGKDYDLGRAGQRAAVGAGGALASTGLADALKGSGNALLKSGTAQGLARGAVGGAIGAGGYTAIDGGSLGDVANSALQGAGMGAALGGTMGALQDFKPVKTYDMALTDEEKTARIANAKNMLASEQDPERIAELNNQIKSLGGEPDGERNYRTFATGDEAREYFSKNNPAYWDGLPSSVDEGIQEYTRNGYSRVNDMLRTGQDNYGYPDTDVLIGDIERGIEGYNLPDGIKVYRRSAADAYKNLGVGDTFTDEGFTSTSISPNVGGDFGKANIEINVGNGKGVGAFIGDLSSGNGDEGEFLLQRGTKYKVLGRGQDGTLQLEVVGNERRPLEQILSASDAAVNSPRYLTDENGNPRTFYHGSPNKDITEFDINRAGRNTSSGERALYFTDSPDVADEFSYERIPTESMFIENKGAKGKVYPVNLEMNNPLDLDNLTDAQVDELWPYASKMGSWQGEDVFKRDINNWRNTKNAQLIKGYLDLEKLADSPYDGLIARMYPNQENQAREYAVFDNSKIKMLEDALVADDIAVNEARIAPGQLGLFDDAPTQAPKTGTRQASLFDQPMSTEQIEGALALDGEYSPKDNKVTKAMRARAEEIMGDYKTSKKVPENELYNKIDESTLPGKRKSTGAILDDLYSKGVKPDDVSNNVLDQLIEKEIGGKMDKNSLATYLFGDMDDTTRKDFIKKNLYTTKDYDVDDLTESILKNWARRKAIASGTMNKYNIDNLALAAGNKTIRQGYTGALDSALSERLGIAPGNTYKQNGEFDTPGALGRYIGSESRPDFNNYMVKEVPDIEEALNTAGHERLHSFQAESRLENRYSKEVADAYNELASDLKKASAYKSDAEIKNRYKKGAEYWGDADEQEARMLQQYLGARGFTDYNKRDARTYGGLEFDNDKIVPAFDKFFDKLRDLSKRGVALPAITALLGGGALMAGQQKDKKEVK